MKYDTQAFICPYCYYEYTDSIEWKDEGTKECCSCKKTFSFERNVEIVYMTKKMFKAYDEE